MSSSLSNKTKRKSNSQLHNKKLSFSSKATLKETLESCKKLCNFKELPFWLQENHFILNGYRPHLSIKECLSSLFYCHNETWCIYTHLLAAVSFGLLALYTFSTWEGELSAMDIGVFSIFFIGAVAHFAFSTLYHLFFVVSPNFYLWLAKLDYTGISLMITVSCIPPLFYGFECHPFYRTLYIGIVSTMGIIGLIVSFVPTFAQPRFHVTRAIFFVSFGLSCVAPLPHLIYLNGIDWVWPLLWRELIMGTFYIIGAVVYATRFPEAKYPGKFDLHLTSHTIWHFFTIGGALTQYIAILKVFELRQQVPCLF